jgi:hypothetical protein
MSHYLLEQFKNNPAEFCPALPSQGGILAGWRFFACEKYNPEPLDYEPSEHNGTRGKTHLCFFPLIAFFLIG